MTPDDIAALMRDLLDSDDVAVDDGFFDAGGTSISALTLISQVRQRSGVALTLTEVLRDPTPEGLAALVTRRARQERAARPGAPR